MSVRISITVPDGLGDLVDGLVRASGTTGDVPTLSKARVFRLLATDGANRLVEGEIDVHGRDLEDAVDADDLLDLVPDHVRAKYLRDEVKAENWLADMRGGFEGRVRDALAERFKSGYDPEAARDVAQGYVKEARIYWMMLEDDPETFAEKRDYVHDRIEDYRERHAETSWDFEDDWLGSFGGVEDGREEAEVAPVADEVRAVVRHRLEQDASLGRRELAAAVAMTYGIDAGRVEEIVAEERRRSVVEDEARRAGLSPSETPALRDDGTAHDVEARAPDHARDAEQVDGILLDEDEAAELLDAETDGGVDHGDGPRTDGGRDVASPGTESYWSDLAAAAESDGGDPTVRERIEDELDAEQIHGVAVTAKRGQTVYAVVSHSTEQNGGDVVALTTVVVDLEAETVKPSGNSLWVPREAETLEALTRVVARSTSDVATGRDDEPALASVSDVDVEDLLATEVAPDEFDRDDEGPSPAQGEPPAEVDGLVDRLEAAGIDTAERFIRLRFGGKDPWSHTRGDRDYLVENYGVYATSDDALVLVDVDDPDALEADLVPTYTVSSPHGGDDRAHHYYAVDDLEQYRAALGKYNAGPSWGEVRTANQYVVGPGSQLDGCDKDDCDGACHTPTGGVYEVVDDREVAEVSAEWLIDLLDADPDVDVDRDADPDEDEDEQGLSVVDVDDESEDVPDDVDEAAHTGEPDEVTCIRCDADVPESAAAVYAREGDRVAYVCRGGCE